MKAACQKSVSFDPLQKIPKYPTVIFAANPSIIIPSMSRRHKDPYKNKAYCFPFMIINNCGGKEVHATHFDLSVTFVILTYKYQISSCITFYALMDKNILVTTELIIVSSDCSVFN